MISREPEAPWRLALRMPMVRLAVPFVLGVVLGRGSDPTVLPWLIALMVLGLWASTSIGRSAIWLAMGWAITLVGGGTYTLSQHPEIDLARSLQITGRVAGCWTESDAGWTAPVLVSQVAQGERNLEVRGALRMGLDHLPDLLSRCGGLVRARGYLVGPRRYHNVPLVVVGGDSLFLKSTRLLEIVEGPGWWYQGIGWVRDRVSPPGWQGNASPGERLAHGLALGEATAIDPHWREGLRRVGLSHVLAVSGLHLGLVAAWLALLAFRWRRGWRLLVTLVGLGIYSALVGPQPSVLRAGVMAGIVITALLMRRPPVAVNALGLGVSLLVAFDPGLVARVGFQLSVAATAGIVLLAPGVHRNLREVVQGSTSIARRLWGFARGRSRDRPVGINPRALSARGAAPGSPIRIPDLLLQGVSVTLAAQITTLPWTVGLFHWVSPPAAIFNLLAVPWVGLALGFSLLWVGCDVIQPGLARPILEPLLDLLTYPCEVLADLGPSLWMGQSAVVAPLWLAVASGSLYLWSLRVVEGWGNHLLPLIAAGALWCGSPPVSGSSNADGLGPVRISILDVGQGDAILLQDGDQSVLVDGGGWTRPGLGTRVLAPALRSLGVTHLSMAVVSHPDTDHCGGVLDLLRVLPAGVVVTDQFDEASNPCFEEISSLDVRRRSATAGDTFAVGAWSFTVLGPSGAVAEGGRRDHNSRSLVLRAEAVGRRVLLTGDIDQATEGELRTRWGDEALRCDLLKVAHHGSKSSTSPGWLYATRPRMALISAGPSNRYGHPTEEVLSRLSDRDIRTLRTDQAGRITIQWNRHPGWRIDRARNQPAPPSVPP